MKKITLKNKVLIACMLTGLFMLLAPKMNAQIVYVDIPESTPIPAHIDFNSDGSPEFDIDATGTYITYYNYGSSNNIHAIGTMDTGTWDIPDCVSADYEIGPGSNWAGQGDASVDGWGAGNATITPNADEYLAVRFNFVGDSDVYYGWIRFVMDDAGAITYKDYAYNSTPDAVILAGESDLGIEGFKAPKISLYPNPTDGILHINSESSFDYTVYNMMGQKLNSGTHVVETIDLNNLEAGIYMIRLTDAKTGHSTLNKIIKD